MSAPRRLARALQWLVPSASGPGCTVLCYHLVGAGTGSPVDLPEGLFRRHMEELAEGAEVVPLEEVARELLGKTTRGETGPHDAGAGEAGTRTDEHHRPRPRSHPRVVLTFDDAYRNFHRTVLPVLAELRLPATLFAAVGFVEGKSPPPMASAPLPAASWGELAEAVASGLVSVGSHTWSHPDLTTLSPAEVDEELQRSRDRLEERLGIRARSFCYPRARWSTAAEERVRRVYDLAVVGGGGRLTPSSDPWRIQRVSLRSDGPRFLEPVLRARVWLEERIADRVRRLR